jgi:ComF family protein
VRQLVHRLKYSDRMELAKPLGAWMARAGNELPVEADLLVPVPLHHRRLAARRFNQANSLAQAISAQCGVPVDPFALARVKATPSQVGLSRSQRALNMQGAFRVTEGMEARVEGRANVLIDDVMTSGATVNAAAPNASMSWFSLGRFRSARRLVCPNSISGRHRFRTPTPALIHNRRVMGLAHRARRPL